MTKRLSLFLGLTTVCFGLLSPLVQDADAQYTITNIASVKLDEVDNGTGSPPPDLIPDVTTQNYRVYGRITSPNLATNQTEFYIQDTNDNYGILVWANTWTADDSFFSTGKEVSVDGYIKQVNGVSAIYPTLSMRVKIIDATQVPIAPMNLDLATLNSDPERYEGTYVIITNVYVSSGSWPEWGSGGSVTITQGTESLKLYVDADTDADGQPAPTNTFDVLGIFTQYDTSDPFSSGYEILPRYYSDIMQTSAQEPPSIYIVDSNTTFNVGPDREVSITVVGQDRNAADTLTISTNFAPEGAELTVADERVSIFTWTPDNGYVGTTSTVEFTVSDGSATATARVDIYVLSAAQAAIVLNEIQWDPDSTAGDANGDGFVDTRFDEFIEIVNTYTGNVDISGWKLMFGDTNAVYFTFPASTIMSGQTAAVVFNGGTNQGTFGNALVFDSREGVALANSPADRDVWLRDTTDIEIFRFNYRSFGSPNEAITRDPDGSGDFDYHLNVNPAKRFSPGTKASGAAFEGAGITNTAPQIAAIDNQSVKIGDSISIGIIANDAEGHSITLTASNMPATASFTDAGDGTATLAYTGLITDAGTTFDVIVNAFDGSAASEENFSLYVVSTQYAGLVINEVLADPNANGFDIHIDSNNDGVEDGAQDEFVEILNTGSSPIDLSGCFLSDSSSTKHIFDSVTMQPYTAYVIFGGGSIASFTVADADTASEGSLGLNNESDSVSLYDPDSNLLASVSWGIQLQAESFTCYPDGEGECTNWHYEITGYSLRASPGLRVDGSAFITNQPPVLSPIGNKSVTVSNTLNFVIQSSDPADGDSITLTASNLPPGAVFSPTNGNGSVLWINAGPVGVYTCSFYAVDKDGVDSEEITISVTSGGGGAALDISGYVLKQYESTQSYSIPADTEVQPGGYVVIGRDANQAAFESFWGVTLDASTVFINSGGSIPQLNGAETYELTDGSTTIDGPSGLAASSGKTTQRNNTTDDGTQSGSWTASDESSATPGSGANGNGTAGLVITEYSDAGGTGNYVYEFVELYYDSEGADPLNAPVIMAASSVTTNRFTANWGSVAEATGYILDVATNAAFSAGGGSEVEIETLDFTAGFDDWATISEVGAQVWEYEGTHAWDGNYAIVSGYDGGSNTNVDWLISPALDLTAATDPLLRFESKANYPGPVLQVLVSTDYDGGGSPASATWSELSATLSAGSWALAESGDIDLSAYESASTYVAFRYSSTASESMTWELDNIEIVRSAAASSGDYVPGYQARSVNGTSELVTNLAQGITYYYRVKAINATQESDYSAVTSVVTQASSGDGDDDGDGLPNDWELANFGSATSTNDATGDRDGDGSSNLHEYIADTNPMNGSDYYQNMITNAVGNGIMTIIAGPPTTNSRVYDVFVNTNLSQSVWSGMGFDRTGAADGGPVIFVITNDQDGAFFRTGVKLP